MDDNPYSSPTPAPLLEQSHGDVNLAYDLVNGPARGLIASASIWICLVLTGMVGNIILLAGGAFAEAPNTELADTGISFATQIALQMVWTTVILITNVIILVAALRMRSLRNYGFCQLGAVLAIIPCTGPCYLFGIPFGIWAIIVMNRPGVRDAFSN